MRRAHLGLLIGSLRTELAALLAAHPRPGWRLPRSTTAIQPLIVGDNATAQALAAALHAQGVWVPGIRPPTVPAGTARLRITLSAAHTTEDIGRLADGLTRAVTGLARVRA